MIGWGSCETCNWFGDIAELDEDGKPVEPVWKHLKPYCEFQKKVLPSYDYKTKQCLAYSMSAEFREMYEEIMSTMSALDFISSTTSRGIAIFSPYYSSSLSRR